MLIYSKFISLETRLVDLSFDIWIERFGIQTPVQLSVESDIMNSANRDFVLRHLLTKLFVTLSIGQFNSYEACLI